MDQIDLRPGFSEVAAFSPAFRLWKKRRAALRNSKAVRGYS